MNTEHDNLCASPEWADWLRSEILPAVTAGVDLGRDLLEIGPGPGAATGWLAGRVENLTALETDSAAAARLVERCDAAIAVDTGDATEMPYPAACREARGVVAVHQRGQFVPTGDHSPSRQLGAGQQ